MEPPAPAAAPDRRPPPQVISMHGCLLIFAASGPLFAPPELRELTAPPSLETMQGLVGGPIQIVPAFTTTSDNAACIAFCNEEGKVNDLPVNRRATLLWDAAVRRVSPDGSGIRRGNEFADFLVGTVVVMTGDAAFLAAWSAEDDDE